MKVRYLRLTIDAIASGSVWQISRLDFINSSETRFAYPSSTTGTANYGNFPSSEGILKMLDGSTSTKACCNNYSTQQIITIDLQSEALDLSVYNRWQWYTANDTSSDPGRNLKTFTMEVSVDGTSWRTFTSVVNGSYTSSNYSLAYRSPYIYEITADISPNGSGYITDLGLYEENTLVNIEAVGSGYFLNRWVLGGYTRLEYIQSTGTQYIDTGVTSNNDTIVEMEVAVTGSGSTDGYIFGTAETTNRYVVIVANLVNLHYVIANGTYTSVAHTFTLNAKTHIKLSKDGIIIDNDTFAAVYGNATTGSLWMFRYYTSYAKARFYSCKITNNGVLVRDFIPVIRHSDSSIGLFDLVHFKFYSNNGTGNFIGGDVYAS